MNEIEKKEMLEDAKETFYKLIRSVHEACQPECEGRWQKAEWLTMLYDIEDRLKEAGIL